MSEAPTPVLLAVDLVVRRHHDILFITRKNEPFKGQLALPGGFVDPGETVEAAALRELAEETGIVLSNTKQLRLVGIWSDADRDPRDRVISVVYYCIVAQNIVAVAGDDAAALEWVNIEATWKRELAFDHRHILMKTLGKCAAPLLGVDT